ncbi:MAG: type II secretion system F family protein, partial [Pirellulales bacterium]
AAALPGAASLLLGGAVVLAVYWLVSTLATPDLQQQDDWRYDVSRINELRRQDAFYRSFQPVLQLLARFNRAAFREHLPLIQREIQAAGESRFWLPEEYLARAELVAIFLSPVYAYFAVRWVGWGGLIVALAGSLFTAWFLRHRLASKARYRLRAIKRRMPFLLDLLTLLMGAGSTFLNALRQSVAEFAGDAVALEFGRVLADMNLGKTRTEAFEAMRNRLDDDEITSIIGSILQGEALGTPLADIFRTQADVLRIKRSQRAERIAGEAGVNMLLPGILIMVSTVLVIIGPFMLNYLSFGYSF